MRLTITHQTASLYPFLPWVHRRLYTIATSIVHATSIPAILFTTTCLSILWLPASNSWNSACVVVKPPKSCHITPMLWCLHWFKITECIEYNCCTVTYLSPHNHQTSISAQSHLCSTSSQHSLFISCHSRSAANIILVMYDWLFLSIILISSLECR